MFKLFISDGEEARRSDCVYLTHNLLIVNCEGKWKEFIGLFTQHKKKIRQEEAHTTLQNINKIS